jgi:hypothetical protein
MVLAVNHVVGADMRYLTTIEMPGNPRNYITVNFSDMV